MTCLTFETHRLYNYYPPLSIEEAFRLYAAWGDLHSTSFNRLYELSASNWVGNITPTVVSDTITLDATEESHGWYYAYQSSVELPSSFTFSYHKQYTRQGIVILGTDLSHYLVCTDANSNLLVYRHEPGSYVLKMSLPITVPAEAEVQIVFRQTHYTEIETEYWRSISVYMNGALQGTYIESAEHAVATWRIGFAAFGTDTVSYSNLVIPELCETAEVADIQHGESAISGMQRAIEGRNIRFFVRYDGTFRAWRTKPTDIVYALSVEDGLIEGDVSVDLSEFYTHVRMVGAYTWAEYIDKPLAAQYGHRFEEWDNPMLFTEAECYVEAQRSVKRMEEAAITEPMSTFGLPLLEPEDRITTPYGDWLVTTIDKEYQGATIIQSMMLRKYVWG